MTGEAEAVCGLRSRVAVDFVGLTGVIDFPPDAFKDKDFSGVDEFKQTASNPVRAFRPTSGGRRGTTTHAASGRTGFPLAR